MTVKVLPVVNASGQTQKTELDYHDFEVAPKIGEMVQVTHKYPGGGTKVVSGIVSQIEHRGVVQGSREQACVMIWINLV